MFPNYQDKLRNFLNNFSQGAKSFIGGVQNAVSPPVSPLPTPPTFGQSLLQKAQGFLSDYPSPANYVIPKVAPIVNSAIENIPKFDPNTSFGGKFADIRSPQLKNTPVLGGLTDLAGNIGVSLINTPSNFLQGGLRMYREQLRKNLAPLGLATEPKPQELIGDVGQFGSALLNMLPVKAARETVPIIKGLTRAGIKEAAKIGAGTGFKYGGAQGFLSGLEANRDQTLGEQFKNAGIGAGQSAILGAALGGTIGAGTSLAGNWFAKKPSEIIDDISKLRPGASEAEKTVLMKSYVRDKLGRFAPDSVKKIEFVRNFETNPLTAAEKKALDMKYGWLTETQPGLTIKKLTKEEAEAARRLATNENAGLVPKLEGKLKLKTDEVGGPEMFLGRQPGEGIGDLNIVPKKPIPEIAGSEAQKMADIAQISAETKKSAFDKIFSTFIGERDAAKTRGTLVGSKIKTIPSSNPLEVIKAIENPEVKVSPEVASYIENYRKLDDEVFAQAKVAGIDINYLKNHVAHFWTESLPKVEQAYLAFKQKYGLANSRQIPTYEEGIKMGLTPKFTNPAQILAESVRKLEEAKAGIKAFTQLKNEGFLVPASVGMKQSDFAPITAIGFPKNATRVNESLGTFGNWYAPKQIAEQINRVFTPKDYGPVGQGFKATRSISGTIQDITLSGGVPSTPLNAFTFANVIKEALALRPIQGLKATMRGISDNATRKFFEDNAQQIIKMQERNIPVSTNFSIKNLAPGGLKKNARDIVSSLINRDFGQAGQAIRNIWNDAVNNPTFQRFMPMLQVQYFNDIEKAALGKGIPAGEAADIAAQAVKNFYGITGSDIMAAGKGIHDPLVQNIIGTFTFAPKFRESMVNFWINNIKTLKNPLALENRANTIFIAGAIATYLGMDKLNYVLNGKHLNENPPGTEDKLLIPTEKYGVIGVPFLSSIATVPRALYRIGGRLAQVDIPGAAKETGQSFLSMLVKPAADIAANQDYFGRNIVNENDTEADKLKKYGNYLKLAYNHPYLKELLDPRSQKDPAFQRLSRAMELPFRFYTEAGLDTKYYFGAKDVVVKGLSNEEKTAFNAIPKSDSNDPNTRILKYQIYLTYPNVFEAKQKIEMQTAAQTGKAIDPLFLVNYDTAKKYMRYEALPEGSQDRKDMTKAYPELTALFDIRSQFFNENPIPGQVSSNRPLPSAEIQAAMDRKDWKYPGVREYLDANTLYNNSQREKLGLPPLAGYTPYKKSISSIVKFGTKTLSKKTKLAKMTNLKIKTAKKLTLKLSGVSIKPKKTLSFKNKPFKLKKQKLIS